MGFVFLLTLTAFLTIVALRWLVEKEKKKDDHRKFEHEVLNLLRAINHKVERVETIVETLLRLQKQKLSSARIKLMPKTVKVGETAQANIQGFDQNGSPLPLDSSYSVAYVSSAPADVSVGAVNPDGSAVITAVNPNPGVLIGAIITRPDGVEVTATADVLLIEAVTTPVLTTANVVLT